MTTFDQAMPARGQGSGILDRERIIAKAGFNRWLVPPAALCIHLCIGMAYGFSVFWLPLSRALGITASKACPDMTLAQELFTTTCDWRVASMGWMFTLFFVLLGVSAAIWGGWLERVGPRKAGVVAAICWGGGLMLGGVGIIVHQLWLMWLGAGVIGGVGLGLGYISPVSTLVKWFPDRRGMATGMAIMGFGGGAMIGAPLANILMNYFKSPTDVGAWQTFFAMGAIYFFFMMVGAFRYCLPPAGWRPEGWTPPSETKSMITQHNVHLKDAHKTPQFWLIWLVLCMNVSAGIGVIGAASPMLQETFGGRLFGDPSIGFAQFNDENRRLAAAVATGFVGLFSLFNIGGRFFWASLSDHIGRKATYYAFFILGLVCYGSLTTLANASLLGLFAASCCVIASMYGGGFATVPAYLADMFGAQYVGAIHGRLLTAWSTAGIVGPVLVNYLHDSRVAEGVPRDHIYDAIFYWLVGLLVIGLIANALVRPVADKWFIKPEAGKSTPAAGSGAQAGAASGIGFGGLDGPAALAWLAVGVPIAWGVYMTLLNAAKIF